MYARKCIVGKAGESDKQPEGAGQAKVDEIEAAIAVVANVLRLDIRVSKTTLVQELQRVQHLPPGLQQPHGSSLVR